MIPARPGNDRLRRKAFPASYIALFAKIRPIYAPYNARKRAIAAVFRPLFLGSYKNPF